MGKTICIDAGHYGKYNQSPAVKNYYESDVMWKLHLLQKKHLESYGFNVILTRGSQSENKAVYDRGVTAKGCDLFISLHSNAVGSYVNESVDYPVVYVPLNGKGDELGQRLADCIADAMETTQEGRVSKRKSSSGGEYYGVIRGAVAVGTMGMIIEHSFHTNTRSTNWLLKDSNLEKLAKAEAAVIAEYFGLTKSSSTTKNEGSSYMFNPETVKNGSKGKSVTLLQRLLKVGGYKGKDGRVLAIDGDCGTNTTYAINSYQSARRKQGVELGTNGANDGICGKKMWADIVGI